MGVGVWVGEGMYVRVRKNEDQKGGRGPQTKFTFITWPTESNLLLRTKSTSDTIKIIEKNKRNGL